MNWVKCATQAELDAAVKRGNGAEVSAGYFDASGSASVRAYGSASVRAYGSASVRAYDSASVRAYGSASVSAYGSASVRASDSASVRAYDSASVRASEFVAVHIRSKLAKVRGGVVIRPRFTMTTAAKWCAEHHVKVVREVATLYKAVNTDFMSPRGGNYAPGTTPEAADWDGGKAECGGGLHFSPHPLDALMFHDSAKRFVACKVRVADMRAPKASDEYPHKIKARGCCGPCVECNVRGEVVK